MASTDARPIPLKNAAYRVVFPILDADGDLVTGAAGLDSEVSKDQGTFADCTNEATEIATTSGMYYLDLTSTEMNADCVAVIVKTSTTDAKTTVIVLYPEEAGDIRANVTQNNGNAPASTGRGTATSGGTTTSVPTSAFTPAPGATDQFKGRVLIFDAATTTAGLRGAAATISASTNSSTPTFTVGTLPASPASGDTFTVV